MCIYIYIYIYICIYTYIHTHCTYTGGNLAIAATKALCGRSACRPPAGVVLLLLLLLSYGHFSY